MEQNKKKMGLDEDIPLDEMDLTFLDQKCVNKLKKHKNKKYRVKSPKNLEDYK